MGNKIGRVIQPNEIFTMLNVKNLAEAEKVFVTALEFLVYMKPGDRMEMPFASFSKLDSNLVYVDAKLEADAIFDELSKKKVIKIPL